MQKLLIASDHAGFKLKETLKTHLSENYELIDLGTDSENSVDYPDFGYAMATAIENKKADKGILICGSGIGISIASNRNPHVRAALINNEELSRLARLHNDANVICLGSRMTDLNSAIKLVDIFLNTAFEGGRHVIRVKKLSC